MTMYLMAVLAALLIVAMVVLLAQARRAHERAVDLFVKHAAERELAWRVERQQLLDRIQADSFTEYKQAEIKMTKIQQGAEREQPALEPM